MYDTTQFLDKLRQQTERFLQQAVGEWQTLSPEALAAQPGPARWSAAQCLEHLNIYGRYYLPAMGKAIRAAQGKGWQPARHFRSGWLGAYFARLMRPRADGTLASNMTSPANAVPAPAPDPRAMLAEFIDQLEQLLALLDQAERVSLGRTRVPISIAPWIRLKLGDTFLFFTAHIERHLLQAGRAVAAAQPERAVSIS